MSSSEEEVIRNIVHANVPNATTEQGPGGDAPAQPTAAGADAASNAATGSTNPATRITPPQPRGPVPDFEPEEAVTPKPKKDEEPEEAKQQPQSPTPKKKKKEEEKEEEKDEKGTGYPELDMAMKLHKTASAIQGNVASAAWSGVKKGATAVDDSIQKGLDKLDDFVFGDDEPEKGKKKGTDNTQSIPQTPADQSNAAPNQAQSDSNATKVAQGADQAVNSLEPTVRNDAPENAVRSDEPALTNITTSTSQASLSRAMGNAAGISSPTLPGTTSDPAGNVPASPTPEAQQQGPGRP